MVTFSLAGTVGYVFNKVKHTRPVLSNSQQANIAPFYDTCWDNTLRPRQYGHHFADDIFKCIFWNRNVWILIAISLKFVPRGPMNNISALVQIMAWRRTGDKPLFESMMAYVANAYMRHSTSMGQGSWNTFISVYCPFRLLKLSPRHGVW